MAHSSIRLPLLTEEQEASVTKAIREALPDVTPTVTHTPSFTAKIYFDDSYSLNFHRNHFGDTPSILFAETRGYLLSDTDASSPLCNEECWIVPEDLSITGKELTLNEDEFQGYLDALPEDHPSLPDLEGTFNCRPDVYRKVFRGDVAICIPVHVHDHRCGMSLTWSEPLDTDKPLPEEYEDHEQFLYMTYHALSKEFNGDKEEALRYMKAELKEANSILEGEVYGYVITDEEGDGDSCWGFIGKDALSQMIESAGEEHRTLLTEAFENVTYPR